MMILSFLRVRVVLKVVAAIIGERGRPVGSMTAYFDQAAVIESAGGDTVRPVAIYVGGAAFLHPSQYFQLN